jgi:DNA-binding response OmpR family regulator
MQLRKMTEPLNILLVDDSADDAFALIRRIKSAGFAAAWRRVQSETEYRAALITNVDIIFADVHFSQFSVRRALDLLRELHLDIPFIILSRSTEEQVGLEGLINDATDFVLKHRLDLLGPAVRRALREARGKAERRQLEAQLRQVQKMRDFAKVAEGVAHDFNNILMAIMMDVDLSARYENLPSEVQENLNDIKVLAGRGATLMRQFLIFGRPEDSENLAAARSAGEAGAGSPRESERKHELRGGAETILLVESDAAVRRLTGLALVRHGYCVLLAGDAATALQLGARHKAGPIDLVLTDLSLPGGISGMNLATQLRDAQPSLKVILMQASGTEAESHRSSVREFVLLPKPCSMHQLLHTVRATLDRLIED